MTGLSPSEHGLTRAHVYLSEEARTLAEKLAAGGFWTHAFIETGSLLHYTHALKGFSRVEITDPKETITRFLRFFDRLPEYRKIFALIELNIDSLGGPRFLETALEVLYEGIGKDAYLENNILALAAADTPSKGDPLGLSRYDPRIAVVIAGKPLLVGPGKYVLKPVSICDLKLTLNLLALGEGFDIRDAVRTGKAIVTEAVLNFQDPYKGEVCQPPPVYSRMVLFDDDPYRYFLFPGEEVCFLGPKDEVVTPAPERAEIFHERFRRYLAQRILLPDQAIPQNAGPILDETLAFALGEPWNREELLGHGLHAVEHFRLAEALRDSGYSALAINELNNALTMDDSFPIALFTLAEVYASIDPKGAESYYREFFEKYGDSPEFTAEIKKTRFALQSALKKDR